MHKRAPLTSSRAGATPSLYRRKDRLGRRRVPHQWLPRRISPAPTPARHLDERRVWPRRVGGLHVLQRRHGHGQRRERLVVARRLQPVQRGRRVHAQLVQRRRRVARVHARRAARARALVSRAFPLHQLAGVVRGHREPMCSTEPPDIAPQRQHAPPLDLDESRLVLGLVLCGRLVLDALRRRGFQHDADVVDELRANNARVHQPVKHEHVCQRLHARLPVAHDMVHHLVRDDQFHQHRAVERVEVVDAVIQPPQRERDDDIVVARQQHAHKLLEETDVQVGRQLRLVHRVKAFQERLQRAEERHDVSDVGRRGLGHNVAQQAAEEHAVLRQRKRARRRAVRPVADDAGWPRADAESALKGKVRRQREPQVRRAQLREARHEDRANERRLVDAQQLVALGPEARVLEDRPAAAEEDLEEDRQEAEARIAISDKAFCPRAVDDGREEIRQVCRIRRAP
eukprot:m.100095 g.100095  ORF g.100095 m.100095 type:complete len:457 (+) comp8740_c0_seq3:147-1517(+)